MNPALRIDIVWLFSFGLALMVAWCAAKGLWLGMVAVVGGTAILFAAIRWPGLLPTLWLLGTPTVFVIADNALKGVPLLTVERALFVVSGGLFLVRFLVRPQSMAKLVGVEKAMGLYVLVMIVSWFMHMSGKTGAETKNDVVLLFESFIMPFTAFVMARNFEWDDRTVTRFLRALVFGVGGYLVVVGMLQHWLHMDFFLSLRSDNEHPDRVTGPFTNALEYGTVMMLVLLTAIYLFVKSRSRFEQVSLTVLIAGMTLGLALSKGRAVWLSIPLALGFVFWRVPQARRLIAAGSLVIVVLAAVVGPIVADTSDLSRRLDSPEEYYNRMALWGTAGNMIVHAPIFGYGFGADTFLRHKEQYYHGFNGVSAVWAAWPSVPHNELLHNAILAGVFGLGACLLLWFAMWRALGRATSGRIEAAGADYAPYVQAGFVVVIINALFLDMMFLAYVPLLFFFLAGLALRPAPIHGHP